MGVHTNWLRPRKVSVLLLQSWSACVLVRVDSGENVRDLRVHPCYADVYHGVGALQTVLGEVSILGFLERARFPTSHEHFGSLTHFVIQVCSICARSWYATSGACVGSDHIFKCTATNG